MNLVMKAVELIAEFSKAFESGCEERLSSVEKDLVLLMVLLRSPETKSRVVKRGMLDEVGFSTSEDCFKGYRVQIALQSIKGDTTERAAVRVPQRRVHLPAKQ